MIQNLNPLTLPLQGQQLIEASAGTGKTWTLSALYIRLILGHKQLFDGGERALLPPDILVMTFTEAATAELRERIRVRLEEAIAVFSGQTKGDPFLSALMAEFSAEQYPQCLQRLSLAIEWMDEAAIYTIHGWASRMLRQYAFESLAIFEQQLLEDTQTLRLAMTKRYWRRWYYALDDLSAMAIQRVAKDPEALLSKIQPRIAEHQRDPNWQPNTPQPPSEQLKPWLAWQARRLSLIQNIQDLWQTNDAMGLLIKALTNKTLNGRYYSVDKIEALATWLTKGSVEPKVSFLSLFATGQFKINKGHSEPVHAVFDAILAYLQHVDQQPEYEAGLLAHAEIYIEHYYQQAKQLAGKFDFNDLLTQLYTALQGHNGGPLADNIRAQYPVVLVDEFQDTDPWQYGCFNTLYARRNDCLFLMIGDPKQAIYRFRGADIHTYLRARQDASAHHTLTQNFRSTPAMIQSINALFLLAEQHPKAAFQFKSDDDQDNPVPFVEVSAGKSLTTLMRSPQDVQPAVTLWAMQSDKFVTKTSYQQHVSELCASEIVRLLLDDSVGFKDSKTGFRRCQANDIAILVRSTSEAKAIRQALTARQLPSVYLSDKDSVLTSPEALDVWRWLVAVNEPESQRNVSAALASKTFAMPLTDLDLLVDDESAWDEWVTTFRSWRDTWQQQGILAMLYRILHEQKIAHYWMAQPDGERRLTNLLHLAEVLQQVAQQREGRSAVIRWLAQQIAHPELAPSKAHLLRLESDAACIQIITIHKSKGLEYPLVFVPFAMNIGINKHQTSDPIAQQQELQESIRLLYVALTRASHALWLGIAGMKSTHNAAGFHETALGYLLNGGAPVESDTWSTAFNQWRERAGHQLYWQTTLDITDISYRADNIIPTSISALTPKKRHWPYWRISSYSSLVHQLSERPRYQWDNDIHSQELLEVPLLPPFSDESVEQALWPAPTSHVTAWQSLPAGAQIGELIHSALEWQIKAGWPNEADNDWQIFWHKRCQTSGLDLSTATALETWIHAIGQHPLSLSSSPSFSLASLHQSTIWPEMAFWLPLSQTHSQHVDTAVRSAICHGRPRPHLSYQQLGGLLTGFMDAVFVHNGRYYILDYKTNKLDKGYNTNDCEENILAHRYDVQAMLYIVALHRLLNARLPNYNYEAHMGGAVYWYIRGVNVQYPKQGLWHCLPSEADIERLANLLTHKVDVSE